MRRSSWSPPATICGGGRGKVVPARKGVRKRSKSDAVDRDRSGPGEAARAFPSESIGLRLAVEVSLVICPSCETDNRSGARFCRGCGVALERLCPACGAAVDVSQRFCDECGVRLDAAPPAV